MKQLRILTNIDANHGSCIFNVALDRIMKTALPSYETKFLNTLPPSWRMYEILRLFKLNRQIPFYNLGRYRTLMRFSYRNLDIEAFPDSNHYERSIRRLQKGRYDALLVGKVIWDIARIWQTPQFPNLLWLSEKIPAVKIAYAVSGHRTDWRLFLDHKEQVHEILSSYALIGVRDEITRDMMAAAGVDRVVDVQRVSDPAFLFEEEGVDRQALLKKYGIDPDRPVLGLLYYGKPELSDAVCQVYRQKGYQIINFNMFNPFADINIGHRVDAFEWAALYAGLSFCITDRFHSSIFCIKNGVPFAAIEPYQPRETRNSKVFSLMKDFNLEKVNYFNTYDDEFSINGFLNTCEELETSWQKEIMPGLKEKLNQSILEQQEFIQKIQKILGEMETEEPGSL